MTAKKHSIRAHNNLKLCELLARHLADCTECDPTWNGSYCETGMHLRMMLGRTDTSGPRYDRLGFRINGEVIDKHPPCSTSTEITQAKAGERPQGSGD